MSSSSTAAGYRRPQAATECDKLFIGGKWVKPSTGDVIEVHSPATGAYVGKVPLAAKADVDAAVAAARTAFAVARSPWPATPPAQRAAVIGAAVKLSTRVPFGGYKNSGIGREFGPEGIEEFCQLKSVLLPMGHTVEG
jgi:acyl-CoA reductase-like NAD-dependent aldehyde dehydrogenase